MNSRPSAREEFVDISLHDVVAPLFRRKRVFITTFLVVFAAAILAALLTPPQFTSQMSILVNRERLDPLVTTEVTTQMPLDGDRAITPEEINSEAELLRSRDVLEKVVLANGLQEQRKKSLLDLLRPKRDEADRVEAAVRSLASKLKIDKVADSNLIEVTYSSSDPRLAYGILSSLSRFYMEKHIELHQPPGAYEFFAQEAQKYLQALQNSEARLRSFQQQPDAEAPDLVRTNMAVQVANSVGQLHSIEQTIASDEQRIRTDQDQMKVTPERSEAKQDVQAADYLLQSLGSALLAAQEKRSQLAMKYGPNYPLVQEADEEIANAKAAIAQAEKSPYVNRETDRDPTFELLREDLAKTQSDLASQRANLTAVKRSIGSMQNQMADLDQKSITQEDLLRDAKADEDNYLLYLSKQEQEQTSDALNKTRIANVSIAVPPAVPALPAHGLLFIPLVGLGLASMLALAMAYIVDYFDSSFHTPAQVIDILDIPVVVSIAKRTA
jgi:polysaccharide biosynthesis protein PslE